MVRNDFYRQLRIFLDHVPGSDRTDVSVFARVSDRGTSRDRLLLTASIDHRLGDFPIADTLRSAGEILQREAFRMSNPAPQAPRDITDQLGRVVTGGNRLQSLS
jgi:hypothetical protein